MSPARKLLMASGLVLATLGMLYGLYYAAFVEHQTLDRMGGALAQGFVHAAQRNLPEAHSSIDEYAAVKYDYVRQVDLHSHWIGLAMLLIVLGAAFDWVALDERSRMLSAAGLAFGSFLFPLGVILQTLTHGSGFSKGLAIVGSALVIIALAAVAWGFAREAREPARDSRI